MTTDEPDRRNRWPGDAVLSGVVDAATRKLAGQTEEAFSTRAVAAGTAEWNMLDQQRAGHLFELWHTHSFNIDAIRKGETRPHALSPRPSTRECNDWSPATSWPMSIACSTSGST